MPIYEYTCRNCGENFEVLHRTRGEAAACLGCGSGDVQRRFSTFAARVAVKRPSCEGSTPSCSESRCRSGSCKFARG